MHDTNLLEDQPIAWTPTPEVIERSQLTRFMRQVGVTTWDELYEFSIRDVEKFTEEVLKFLDIKFDPPYSRLLDTSEGIEFPSWFISPPRRGDAEEENAERGTRNAESDTATGQQEAETRPVGRVPYQNAERGMRNAESDVEQSEIRDPNSEIELTGSQTGLNITTMCLDRWQTEEMKDQPAVIFESELQTKPGRISRLLDGVVHNAGGSEGPYSYRLTYGALYDEVVELACALRHYGFGKGDAIGIHLPMTPWTVVCLLAIARIGAIAVPVFSGYGVEAIAARLNAVKAKALFTMLSFPRRGKTVTSLQVAIDAVSRVPSIEKVFWDNYEGDSEGTVTHPGLDERFIFGPWIGDEDKVEPTSAEDPLIILYTSGTTGKPKGIAHTHASFPIKAAQDMAFGTDVGRGTRISWYTDIGWMMGPWLIYGALINGATICIYDGAPDYPTPDRMWEFCAKHKVEVLGISPTLVRALAAHEESRGDSADNPRRPESQPVDAAEAATLQAGMPAVQSVDDVTSKAPTTDEIRNPQSAIRNRHDLSSLRAFASTGEPWNPAPWWWLFEQVGNSKLPIINYSGGTEIAGGILMGNPLLPIKPCSFPAPCPGMDVDILDEDGNPVEPGKVGELVIKQPWIGMARGFWQERERYLDTYWRRFPNIWVHGDWAMRDKDGHWFILGRSDDTLKVAGKRVGPAEVESLLVAHPLVTEAAVIGVPDEKKGTAMVAFCVLSTGPSSGSLHSVSSVVKTDGTTENTENTERKELEIELKSLVAKDMGKPLAPSKIHFIKAVPKTRNAKVMRRVIRAAYLGEDPGDLSALENPTAVDEIRELN